MMPFLVLSLGASTLADIKHISNPTIKCGDVVNGIWSSQRITFAFKLPTDAQRVTINACGSTIDTTLRLFDDSISSSIPILADDDGCENGHSSSFIVARNGLAAGLYHIELSADPLSQSGHYDLHIVCDDAPQKTAPTDQHVETLTLVHSDRQPVLAADTADTAGIDERATAAAAVAHSSSSVVPNVLFVILVTMASVVAMSVFYRIVKKSKEFGLRHRRGLQSVPQRRSNNSESSGSYSVCVSTSTESETDDESDSHSCLSSRDERTQQSDLPPPPCSPMGPLNAKSLQILDRPQVVVAQRMNTRNNEVGDFSLLSELEEKLSEHICETEKDKDKDVGRRKGNESDATLELPMFDECDAEEEDEVEEVEASNAEKQP